MRNVLVHYHLFKNAGSSVDAILKSSFLDKWHAFDPPNPAGKVSAEDLTKVIEQNKECVAFSSHCIVPPLPVGDFNVFPIVVLRDPISRVMSAYMFEWKKQLNLDEPKGTLAEYIEAKLTKPRANAIEDFQTIRLSVTDRSRTSPMLKVADDLILENAKEFISQLPVYGLVEEFDTTLEFIQKVYCPVFPDLKVENIAHNVTQNVQIPLHKRHDSIKNNIGEALFNELVVRNQMDIKLYQYAVGRFHALTSVT